MTTTACLLGNSLTPFLNIQIQSNDGRTPNGNPPIAVRLSVANVEAAAPEALESVESQPPRNVESEWSPTSLRMALESKWRPNQTLVSLWKHKKLVCK